MSTSNSERTSTGRDSLGARVSLVARVPEPLKTAVQDEANRAGMGQSEFLNRLLQFALGVPLLPASDDAPDAETLTGPHPAVNAADSLIADLIEDDSGTLAVLDEFDRAAAKAGLQPRLFALALGHSPATLASYRSRSAAMSAADLLKAIRIADGLEDAARQGWSPPPAAAFAISHNLAHRNAGQAFAEVIQSRENLRSAIASSSTAICAWDAAPCSPLSVNWHALLAAVVAHEFDASGLRQPKWTRRPYLFLSRPWFPYLGDMSVAQVRAHTPRWLADRSIFIAEEHLRAVAPPK